MGPTYGMRLCRKLVLPLSRSRMQWLQESAVRRVYPAGWPKIHHLLRLPFAPPALAELLFRGPKILSGIPSCVTYCFATFLLVPFTFVTFGCNTLAVKARNIAANTRVVFTNT